MNTTSRIGKIARLPHSIREQLNLKLNDGIPAKSILPWLNSLPETKSILATEFDNRPITKQNLSDWKHGGFRDWLLQFQAANFLQFLPDPERGLSCPQQRPSFDASTSAQDRPVDLTEHATPNTPSSHPPSSIEYPASALTAKLLLWTQLQYVSMARHIDSESDPDRKWSALRHFANDISRLKRSSLADEFLQIQRDWLALSQSNTAEKKEKQFWNWIKRPDIEKKLFPDRKAGLTPEQIYDIEKAACLLDGPGPEIAELMAEVRIAKKLLEARKAQQAEAKAKADPDYDPNRPLPDTKVRLPGMPFEELFPTIPETPLTETHPELDDDLPDETDAASPLPHTSSTANQSPSGGASSCASQSGGASVPASRSSAPSDQSDPPALRSLSSEALLAKEDALGEGGSDPAQLARHSSERRRVKASPAESSQIQPPPPPEPDVTP